jgi:glycosyltransferase involved in cell wall biosynthesis
VKIGLVIPTLKGGGAERLAVVLSESLTKQGHIINLIVLDNSSQSYRTDCNVTDLNIVNSSSIITRILNIFKRLIRLNQVFLIQKNEVVISFMTHANFYTSLLSRQHDFKLVSTLHNYNSDKVIDGYFSYRMIQNFIFKNSVFIVCVSDEIKRKYVNLFPSLKDKFIRIYNPFTPKTNAPKDSLYERIKSFKADSILVVNTGRLEHQKGQWLLIDAFKRLLDLNYKVKLIIFGEGSLRSILSNLVDEFSITEHVLLIGHVEDPYLYYDLCDLFIMTSIYEGLPIALLEAMASGLPIISTDCLAGPAEILNPENISLYDLDEVRIEKKYGLLTHTPINNYDVMINMAENEDIIREIVKKTRTLLENQDLLIHYRNQSSIRSRDFSINSIKDLWSKLIFEKLT